MLPRMRCGHCPVMTPDALPAAWADFALWAIACRRVIFGFAQAGFRRGVQIESDRLPSRFPWMSVSHLVEPIQRFMSDVSEWAGTATELLAELNRSADETARSHPKWPKDCTRLSGQLGRIAPNLRSRGLDVRHSKESSGQRRKLVTLAKVRL